MATAQYSQCPFLIEHFDPALTTCMEKTIPIVDLSRPEAEVVQRIKEACSTYGFFYVKNHGISIELREKVFMEVRKFFDLPLEEKLKIQQDKNDRGYVAPFAERLDVKTKKGDSKERINFGLEDLEGVIPLRGPNLWPDATLLPDFKSTIQKYFDQVYYLAQKRLTRLMALSLGLESTAFDTYIKDPTAIFHPLHYLKDLSKPEEGSYACGAHSDYGIVTVLATDEVAGLQIRIADKWIDVPYKRNMFIVNIGDMVERLTDGLYKSTVHRVINTHGMERYSIPFFLNPNMNAEIEPMAQFCEGGIAKFSKCVYGDYLFDKYRTTNDDYTGPEEMTKKEA